MEGIVSATPNTTKSRVRGKLELFLPARFIPEKSLGFILWIRSQRRPALTFWLLRRCSLLPPGCTHRALSEPPSPTLEALFMHLLLLDIDGTLLRAHGAGSSAIETAISSVTGQPISTDGISFSGRTDPNILRDVVRENGLVPNPNLMDEITATYTEAARSAIVEKDVERLPGTAEFLSLLAERDDIYLALVTGNVEPVAYQKLKAVGFAHYFSVGAFGSDHAARSKLPGLAMHRATKHTGHAFSMANTLVIGDTTRDIECARDAGAHSGVVATGHPSSSDLAARNPDLLLDTFEPPELTIERILDIFANEPRSSQSRHDL